MRVLCRHGHFAFYPQGDDEVRRFIRLFGADLESEADYFTFTALKDLPRWSQIARPFGALPATATFEGRHASDVMRENGFVYSLTLGVLVPYASVTVSVALPQARDYIVAAKPLLQPGAIMADGDRLLDYEGVLNMGTQRLYLSSIGGLL